MFGLVLGLVTQVLVSNTGYDNVEGMVNFNTPPLKLRPYGGTEMNVLLLLLLLLLIFF